MGAHQQILLAEGSGTNPVNSDFSYWTDGQPLVGNVYGNDFSFWVDGEPIVENGT